MAVVPARGEWSQEALELAEQYHPGKPGTESGYRRGCRCPECVEAHRAKRERDSDRRRERKQPAGGGGQPGGDKRHQRRSSAAAGTIRDFIRLRRPDLDTDALTLLEVIDRDADAWGDALAWLAELVLPLGLILDAIAGAPPVRVIVKLVPSFRAARRVNRERRARARAEQEEGAEAGLEPEPTGEEGLRVMPGLETQPVEPDAEPLTREEWLAGGREGAQ